MQIAVSLIVLAFIVILLVWMKVRSRGMSAVDRKRIGNMWTRMQQIDDPARRILEADSILDKALSCVGYSGSLGEKLKKAGPRFSNVQAVWNAHKLRNRIAHEPGTQVSDNDAKRALGAFRSAIDSL